MVEDWDRAWMWWTRMGMGLMIMMLPVWMTAMLWRMTMLRWMMIRMLMMTRVRVTEYERYGRGDPLPRGWC